MNVLYLSSHVGALMPMLIHKLNYHLDDFVAFLGPISNLIDYEKIIQVGILSKYQEVDTGLKYSGEAVETIKDAEKIIEDYYDNLLAVSGIDLNIFERVYAAYETSTLWPKYLELKKINYIFFEWSPDSCQKCFPKTLAPKLGVTAMPIKYDWYTPNKYCMEILYHHLTKHLLECWRGKSSYFDYCAGIRYLNPNAKQNLLSVFNFDSGDYTGKWSIFLPNGNMSGCDIKLNAKTYHWIHQFFIDFYTVNSAKLIVKMHPYEKTSDKCLKKMVPYVRVWPKRILSDIFLLIDGLSIEDVYYVVSASGGVLGEFARKSHRASSLRDKNDWYRTMFYESLISIYFSCRFIELNMISYSGVISCCGISINNLRFFVDTAFKALSEASIVEHGSVLEPSTSLIKFSDAGHNAVIKAIRKIKPETAIIFNIRNMTDIAGFRKIGKNYNCAITYKISKSYSRCPDDYVLYEDMGEEYIFILSNDDHIISSNRMIIDMKVLHNAGIILTCVNLACKFPSLKIKNDIQKANTNKPSLPMKINNDLTSENKALKSDLKNAMRRVRNMESSTSWKVTKPMRFIVRNLRALFKKRNGDLLG